MGLGEALVLVEKVVSVAGGEMTVGVVTVGGEISVSIGGGVTVGLISLEGEINFSPLVGWVEIYC